MVGRELITSTDVAIVGGGMVGGLLAAALAAGSPTRNSPVNHGASSTHTINADSAFATTTKPLSVCVIENHFPDAFNPGDDPSYDLRVSALSIASQNMLVNVGAWQGVLARRACPYRRLSAWDHEGGGRTDFDANDIDQDFLGHIIENRVIQLALLDRLKKLSNVSVISPARIEHYSTQADTVQLSLSDGQVLQTRLLVGADGAASSVRKMAGIALHKSPYDQHALVASVETELAQQDITWQRFLPAGPQAMLPLCGKRASLVWYDSKEHCEQRLALSDEDFKQAVQSAFPADLGGLDKVVGRSAFPIAKAHSESYIAPRVALVGDAAHTVHPLAGQGVNLGLMDAAILADLILSTKDKNRDIGSQQLLRRYERSRRFENQLAITALDTIYKAFQPQPDIVKQGRSLSLNTVNAFSPLKSLLMRYASGVGRDLPSFAMAQKR